MTSKIENHVEQALDRLLQQFKDKPKLASLITAYVGETQNIENALWQLLTERALETAIGSQLDVIGKIVGQERAGLEDEDYRRYLRARIATNRSNGTPEEILTIAGLIINDEDSELTLEQQYPASVVLRETGISMTDDLADILILFLRDAKSGGVRMIIETTTEDPTTTFKWDTPGRGWDSGAAFLDARE